MLSSLCLLLPPQPANSHLISLVLRIALTLPVCPGYHQSWGEGMHLFALNYSAFYNQCRTFWTHLEAQGLADGLITPRESMSFNRQCTSSFWNGGALLIPWRTGWLVPVGMLWFNLFVLPRSSLRAKTSAKDNSRVNNCCCWWLLRFAALFSTNSQSSSCIYLARYFLG